MEAVEFAAAELTSAAGPDQRMRWTDLLAQLPGSLRLEDFCARIGAAPPPGSSTAAVTCEELRSPKRVFLPAELVFVPSPDEGYEPIFGWTTNGLASGSTLEEATLHALMEVLERHSIAMNLALDESCLVDTAELPPPFHRKTRDWSKSGISLAVRYVPNEFGLACFEAAILEPTSSDMAVACGWGFHFDRSAALSQAICEAAQSRVGVICSRGNRTDDTHVMSGVSQLGVNGVERAMARWTDSRRRVNFEDVPQTVVRSVRPAMNDLLDRAASAGMPHVFRRRMIVEGGSRALRGLQVVKVVVPRCETLTGSKPRVGPRLMARILAAQRVQVETRAGPPQISSSTSAVDIAAP